VNFREICERSARRPWGKKQSINLQPVIGEHQISMRYGPPYLACRCSTLVLHWVALTDSSSKLIIGVIDVFSGVRVVESAIAKRLKTHKLRIVDVIESNEIRFI